MQSTMNTVNRVTSPHWPSFPFVCFTWGGVHEYRGTLFQYQPDVAQGREDKKKGTNDNCNPGKVQVHMYEVEAAEVKEQDWGL